MICFYPFPVSRKCVVEAHKAQFSKLVNDIKQREKTTGNSSKPQQVELALTSESTSNYHSTPTRSVLESGNKLGEW